MGNPTASDRRRRIKDAFGERWSEAFEAVLDADMDLMEAYADLDGVAWRGPLPAVVKELIGVAVCGSTTTLHLPGLRRHIRGALAAGATREQLVEALELASVLGIHTCTTGMPILRQELTEAGLLEDEPLDERRREIRSRFEAGRGGWPDFLQDMLVLDPDIVEAYLAYSTVPWKKGHLEPKVKELIYIAIDSQTTHIYETGIRLHMANALRAGATKEEIVEVLALVTLIGFHTCTTAVPILLEELDAAST